jgi:SAM-dependent methyltransferase
MLYDTNFYDRIRAGTQRSAQELVPLLMDALAMPGVFWDDGHLRVIDVGCGEGWWAQTFADNGCETIGIDGGYVETSPLGDRFIPHDLNHPLPLHLRGRFDLAVSLEVAEHLPERRARGFIGDLTDLAPIVVFSAAIPGQGGTGHINEQWPSYWADLFSANGFIVSGALRFSIWDNTNIENWYRQNLLIAVREDLEPSYTELFESPIAHPFPIVHPVLYDYVRGRR